MVTVLRDMTLYGSRYVHGSPLPVEVWGRLGRRRQTVLERSRFLTTKPVVAADSPPVSMQTPRDAGGPSPRRRRKAG